MATGAAPVMLPPAGGDQDRGPILMATYWTEAAFCIIILSLRFYARISIRGLGADDWLMLFSVVLFVITAIFVTKIALIGGGRHVYYLTPDQLLDATKWAWVSQPWAIFLYAPAKSSIAILILRIMGTTSVWRRWSLYFLVGSLFIIQGLACILGFVQCNPPRALWTPSLMATAKCWDPLVQSHFNMFVVSWNIMADIVLALLPITIFWNMNIDIKKKISLCGLLSLGLVAAVFSAYKIQFVLHPVRANDFTWSAYGMQIWTGAEAFVVIICGNIPPLQPLWERFVTHKRDSNFHRITQTSNYKLSDQSKESRRKGTYGSDNNQHSVPSTNTMISRNDGWDDDDERSYKGIKARTDIRISESERELV